jgi:hypothetical protein
MWSNEKAFTLFLIVMSIVFFIGSLEFTLFTNFGGVGAGLLPRALSVILFVLAMVHLLTLVRKKKVEEKVISKEGLKSQLLLGLVVILCLFLTNLVGMILAMYLFMFLTLRLIEKTTWTFSLAFSTVFIVVIFLLFEILLKTSMPKGILF